MMDSGIYAIYNVVADKMYVGKSVQISKRWHDHLKDLCGGRHHNRYLQASWNKYGKGAFIFGVLEELPCDQPALLGQRESHWVSVLQTTSRERGYNLAIVASDGTARASDETRARQRASHLGVKLSDQHVANSAAAHRGLKRSAQTIARLRAANTGQLVTHEQRAKTSAAKMGRALSEDHKARIQAAFRGKVITDDDRRQILARYLAGESRHSLANDFGISPSYVSVLKRGVLHDRRTGRTLVLVDGAWVTTDSVVTRKNGTLVIGVDDAKALAGI